MSSLLTTVRRLLWLVLIGAVGGVVWNWWRDRQAPPSPTAPPEWPPLDTARPAATTQPTTNDTTPADTTPADTTPTTATASVVNALVDAPEARSSQESEAWIDPLDDGTCPVSHPIKANDNSGIFHVPEGRFYGRTKAERCYITAEAALGDGYRQAKS